MSSLLQSFDAPATTRPPLPTGEGLISGAASRPPDFGCEILRSVAAATSRMFRIAGRAASDLRMRGDHFGDHRNGDFLRRHGADVQADGRVNAGELLVGDTVHLQVAVNELHLPSRADHADVGGGRIHRPAQHARVRSRARG